MSFALSNRLQKLPPYLFADLRRKTAAVRARGVDVISLGIGDPDQPTPDPVVNEMVRALTDPADPNKDRYGTDVAPEALPQAFIDFYARRFGVTLKPEQVVVTMGSKDAIGIVAVCRRGCASPCCWHCQRS